MNMTDRIYIRMEPKLASAVRQAARNDKRNPSDYMRIIAERDAAVRKILTKQPKTKGN
jgi:hypothetical protein